MEKKTRRFIWLYPWYVGFIGDLLFYIAIDSLFLTVVKKFSAMQIVSLTFVSTIAYLVLQFPLLWLIQRIGNTVSLRLSAFCMLLSSVFITFCPSYFMVALGRVCRDVSFMFRNTAIVALENNLNLINKRDKFINTRTSANIVYSIITLLISFVASWMFNIHNYLPMIGCVVTCAIGFIISLFMGDYSEHNKVTPKKTKVKRKIKYTKIIILAVAVYGVCYSTVDIGQGDGKLFLQQEILETFNVEQTTLIIGVVVCVSRIIRVLSNMLFVRLYRIYKFKVGVIGTVLLFISIGLMLLGSFLPYVVIKIVVMSVGYIVILFIRDPIQLFIESVVIENSTTEDHNTILLLLTFTFKCISAVMSLCFMLMLLKLPLLVEIGMLCIVALVGALLCLRLHKTICTSKL